MSETYEVGELVQTRIDERSEWRDGKVTWIGRVDGEVYADHGTFVAIRDPAMGNIRKHPSRAVRPTAPSHDWKVGDECEATLSANGVTRGRIEKIAEDAAMVNFGPAVGSGTWFLRNLRRPAITIPWAVGDECEVLWRQSTGEWAPGTITGVYSSQVTGKTNHSGAFSCFSHQVATHIRRPTEPSVPPTTAPQIGDIVRWENPAKSAWAEGELVSITWNSTAHRFEAVRMRVDRCGGFRQPQNRLGTESGFGNADGLCTLTVIQAAETKEQYDKRTGTTRNTVPAPVDPLDAVIDEVSLAGLLLHDEVSRREEGARRTGRMVTELSPAQRSAVSAHWSAQLRARVAEAKERERCLVTYCEVDSDD